MKQGHYYVVDKESDLGIRIQQYFTRCANADKVIDDFVKTLPSKFGLHAIDDAQLCYADDCDAGGLIYISFPKERAKSKILLPMVWDYFEDPDDPNRICYAPRIQPVSRFVRYGKAVNMASRADWEFNMAPPVGGKRAKPKAYMYGDVKRHIMPDNKMDFISPKGKEPGYSLRLAYGTNYQLKLDGQIYLPERWRDDKESNVRYTDDIVFDRALDLFKQWSALPSVPANTLARLLALEYHGSDKGIKDNAYCHYITDPDKHRYIIHTGLTSALSDMREVEPSPSIVAAFNAN